MKITRQFFREPCEDRANIPRRLRAHNRFCWKCKEAGHSFVCRFCGLPTQELDPKARIPAKKASSKEWDQFERLFRKDVPNEKV